MPHPRYSSQEIAERGKALYEQRLRAQVEPGNTGKFLVIDIETGEYEIDREELAAFRRAKAKRPEAPLYLLRIGSQAAYQLGGSVRVVRYDHGPRDRQPASGHSAHPARLTRPNRDERGDGRYWL